MDISVKRTVYYLEWNSRKLDVSVEHGTSDLRVFFKIDGEPVVERTVPVTEAAGMSDADVIHEVEDKYLSELDAPDKYADIILNHSREMKLLKKLVTYTTDYYGAHFMVDVEVEDGAYHFNIKNDKTKDTLNCSFEAKDVPEVLEKFRIYLSGGINISHAVTEHLDMLVQQHPLIR